jgi:hypothetical protein
VVETSGFKFVSEQTFLLDELEWRYPELFSQIAGQIRAGKIGVADGECLMAETMLPDGETLIREILVGGEELYQEEVWGRRARDVAGGQFRLECTAPADLPEIGLQIRRIQTRHNGEQALGIPLGGAGFNEARRELCETEGARTEGSKAIIFRD